MNSADQTRKPGAAASQMTDPATTDSPLTAPLLFRVPMELRWRDLDAFNHVNNASFLTYLEEARLRWFASLGTEWVTETTAPLLAAVQINYRRPIPYPSNIVVELFAERVGTSSVTISHRILREAADASDEEAILYADGHVVIVWINRMSGRPTALPESVRKAAETTLLLS